MRTGDMEPKNKPGIYRRLSSRFLSISAMKIGRKLSLVLGLVVVILAGLSALALWGTETNDKLEADSIDRLGKCLLAEKVSSGITSAADQLGRMVLAKRMDEDSKNAVLEFEKDYMAALEEFKAGANTPKSIRHGADLTELAQTVKTANNTVMELLAAHKFDRALQQFEASAEARSEVRSKARQAELWQEQLLAENERKRKQTSTTIRSILVGGSIFSVAVAMWAGVLLSRGIARPLGEAVTHLEQVAAGDLSRHLAEDLVQRGDEIGVLARSIQSMSSSLRAMIHQISAQIAGLSSSSVALSSNATRMSHGSRGASSKVHAVASAVEELSSTVGFVASGMHQASANLEHVATATGEMTSTIGEIASNSEKARRVTDEANREAIAITDQIKQLGQAAHEIGRVTETITEISSQTNLLALNATIEAARAGAAGKGFAVVANEIKALAQQTATATEDIKSRISGVQSATATGIAEVGKVSQVIQEVSQIVCSIAAAIEQQSVTTRDISQNIVQASAGVAGANKRVSETSDASRGIVKQVSEVDRMAGEMAAESAEVQESATQLAAIAEQLTLAVGRFHV